MVFGGKSVTRTVTTRVHLFCLIITPAISTYQLLQLQCAVVVAGQYATAAVQEFTYFPEM